MEHPRGRRIEAIEGPQGHASTWMVALVASAIAILVAASLRFAPPGWFLVPLAAWVLWIALKDTLSHQNDGAVVLRMPRESPRRKGQFAAVLEFGIPCRDLGRIEATLSCYRESRGPWRRWGRIVAQKPLWTGRKEFPVMLTVSGASAAVDFDVPVKALSLVVASEGSARRGRNPGAAAGKPVVHWELRVFAPRPVVDLERTFALPARDEAGATVREAPESRAPTPDAPKAPVATPIAAKTASSATLNAAAGSSRFLALVNRLLFPLFVVALLVAVGVVPVLEEVMQVARTLGIDPRADVESRVAPREKPRAETRPDGQAAAPVRAAAAWRTSTAGWELPMPERAPHVGVAGRGVTFAAADGALTVRIERIVLEMAPASRAVEYVDLVLRLRSNPKARRDAGTVTPGKEANWAMLASPEEGDAAARARPVPVMTLDKRTFRFAIDRERCRRDACYIYLQLKFRDADGKLRWAYSRPLAVP